ncbi:MAG: zinc-binding dehydrogenase [Candidatus Bathyarchaeota archaeon]|nr:zinc-binding dehydrogenase [Candidatus Bathyarchaeota archaeon]MDH5595595.1 zinc-binding dehydrogenase [Candidatus Bathyarchaeota archaeon]
MKAAVFFAPNDIRVEDVDKPIIRKDDVLLRVESVAVCNATDMHFLKGEIPGIAYPLPPGKPGHECCGEIVEVGESIESLKPGDRVVPGPLYALPCGRCFYCKKGKQELCENPGIADFAYSQFLKVPARFCYSLPKNVSYDEGALIDLLACALHGIYRADVSVGDSVAIIGQGPVGLLLTQLARFAGAENIITCDVVDSRLEKSSKMGSDATINSAKEDPIKRVLELTNGKGVDVSIDAVGKSVVARQAVELVKPGGRAVIFGFHLKPGEIDLSRVFDRELEIRASFRTVGEEDYRTSARLISKGKIDPKSLITHVLPLEKIRDGLDMIEKGLENVIKIILKP